MKNFVEDLKAKLARGERPDCFKPLDDELAFQEASIAAVPPQLMARMAEELVNSTKAASDVTDAQQIVYFIAALTAIARCNPVAQLLAVRCAETFLRCQARETASTLGVPPIVVLASIVKRLVGGEGDVKLIPPSASA